MVTWEELLDEEDESLAACFAMEFINASPLMQFTGLHDKNGKEIYEGDIVRLYGWWNASGPAGFDSDIQPVIWDEEVCGFSPYAIYDCDCGVYHAPEETEVIGNIHENPELLEGRE